MTVISAQLWLHRFIMHPWLEHTALGLGCRWLRVFYKKKSIRRQLQLPALEQKLQTASFSQVNDVANLTTFLTRIPSQDHP